MTVEELMNLPKGMDIMEYQKKLDRLHRLEKQCRSLLDKVTWSAESMDLFDDHSDPLYIKYKELHDKSHAAFTDRMNKIQELKKELKG